MIEVGIAFLIGVGCIYGILHIPVNDLIPIFILLCVFSTQLFSTIALILNNIEAKISIVLQIIGFSVFIAYTIYKINTDNAKLYSGEYSDEYRKNKGISDSLLWTSIGFYILSIIIIITQQINKYRKEKRSRKYMGKIDTISLRDLSPLYKKSDDYVNVDYWANEILNNRPISRDAFPEGYDINKVFNRANELRIASSTA